MILPCSASMSRAHAVARQRATATETTDTVLARKQRSNFGTSNRYAEVNVRFRGKADIARTRGNVRFLPKAEIRHDKYLNSNRPKWEFERSPLQEVRGIPMPLRKFVFVVLGVLPAIALAQQAPTPLKPKSPGEIAQASRVLAEKTIIVTAKRERRS